jgi:hypothetical protein
MVSPPGPLRGALRWHRGGPLPVDPHSLVGYEPRFLCFDSDRTPQTTHEVIITCIDTSDFGCVFHFGCGKLQVACSSVTERFSFPIVRTNFPGPIRRSQYCLHALTSLLQKYFSVISVLHKRPDRIPLR